ncbi:MAG: hypothetical protein ACE5EY_05985 [Anaerolineae bacterium]
MSTDFSWETEDETGWETLPPEENRPRRPRRRWPTVLLILVALAAASVVIYRQVQQRLEEAAANTEADVLSSYQLLQVAAANQDLDLFKSLLSGQQPLWTETQLELAREGWLLDRSPFGLAVAETAVFDPVTADLAALSAGVTVDLSPDLDEAFLSYDQTYLDGTKEVALRQTAVYRRGSSRWLYAPPKPEFWGDWVTEDGAVLTLAYPERDREIGGRLAGDLDGLLAAMCSSLDTLVCPPGLHVQMRLDTDPSSLLDGRHPENQYGGSVQINLPAPTLVGLPVDETGYRSLLNGYAGQMLTAVIADKVGYTCCEHLLFFQALVDVQLSELGVRPWPVRQENYQAIVSGQANSDTLELLWRRDEIDALVDANRWQVYALVEFLLEMDADHSAADLQVFLEERQDFYSWLGQFYDPGSESVDVRGSLSMNLNDAWWDYAFAQVVAAQEPPPIPLPDQDLLTICSPPPPLSESTVMLSRYQFAAETWEVLEELPADAVFLTSLADDSGAVLQDFVFQEEFSTSISRTRIWQGDGPRQQFDVAQFFYAFGQTNPAGTQMLVYIFSDDGEMPAPGLLDLMRCPGDDCRAEPLAGLPVWSPDGRDFFMLPADTLGSTPFVMNDRIFLFDMRPETSVTTQIYRGDGAEIRGTFADFKPIAQGFSPFWINSERYGFVQRNDLLDSQPTQVFVANTSDDEPELLVSSQELWNAMAVDERPSRPDLLFIKYVIVHPQEPDLFFIGTVDLQSNIHLFSFDRLTLEVKLRLELGADSNHSLSFSPDGRYFVATGFNPDPDDASFSGSRAGEIPGETLFLHDIEQNSTVTFVNSIPTFVPAQVYDWSGDGRWLIIPVNDKAFNLVALGRDYQQILPHDLGSCSSIAFVNR